MPRTRAPQQAPLFAEFGAGLQADEYFFFFIGAVLLWNGFRAEVFKGVRVTGGVWGKCGLFPQGGKWSKQERHFACERCSVSLRMLWDYVKVGKSTSRTLKPKSPPPNVGPANLLGTTIY